ncbi:MAG: hypothetical protein ACOC1K_05760 [Nanoarchaeota archaeon]
MYKRGDKVRVKIDENKKYKYEMYVNDSMLKYNNKVVTISSIEYRFSNGNTGYKIEEDYNTFVWTNGMFIPVKNSIRKLKGV